ncbi:uncharacterized protein [Ambystoma mexicanum]|uniref:uncharacterized protein isoform X3 n=1 Tax=Ambystoma mexicanum TaxID=8296 RepID=UPI0037E77E79
MPGQGSHEMEAPFLDAPACFPEEEWKLLKEWQKDLYRNVMKEIHLALLALGPLIVNTVFSLRTKERRKPPSPADSPEAHRICGGGITDGEELFSLNVEDKLDSKSSQKTEEREIHCHSTEDEDTPSIFIDNFGEEVRERSLDTDSGYEIISFCTKEDDGPDFRDDWDRERQQTPSRPTGHEMISFCIKEDEAPDCSEDRDSERQSSPGRLAGHASMATIVTLRVKEEADADCMEPHESEIADCTGSPSERAGSTIETWCVKDEADTYSMECYESEIGEYTECTAERAGSTIETWCVKDEADTYSMECHESEIGEYTECTAERAGSTIETWCVKDEADTYSMECHESEIGEYTECAAGSSSGPVDIKDEDETHFMEVHNPGVVATGAQSLTKPLEYVPSGQGNMMLVYEGYLYGREKTREDRIIWKCSEYTTLNCGGRSFTKGEEIILRRGHNHAPNSAKIAVKRKLQEIGYKAIHSEESAGDIIKNTLANTELHIAAALPSTERIKRTINKTRQKIGRTSGCPNNYKALDIEAEMQKTYKGDDFILHDNKSDSDRLIILGTTENLNVLRQGTIWHVNDADRTCPAPFKQLYTLHVYCHDRLTPLVFCLLQNTTKHTYDAIFNFIRETVQPHTPQKMLMDFEIQAINSAREVFNKIEIEGCYVHFKQSIWRKMKKAKLQSQYGRDAELQHNVKVLCALAFVPKDDVEKHYEEVLEQPFFKNNELRLQPFLDLFEDTWLGRVEHQGQRRPAKCALEYWNCFDSIISGEAKTNNAVEGWHNSFGQSFGARQPTMWKFINILKKEQEYQELLRVQALNGKTLKKTSKHSEMLQERLKARVEQYGKYKGIEYLNLIALCLSI